MKGLHRICQLLMLTASLTLLNTALQANDLDDFVFSHDPSWKQAAQHLKATPHSESETQRVQNDDAKDSITSPASPSLAEKHAQNLISSAKNTSRKNTKKQAITPSKTPEATEVSITKLIVSPTLASTKAGTRDALDPKPFSLPGLRSQTASGTDSVAHQAPIETQKAKLDAPAERSTLAEELQPKSEATGAHLSFQTITDNSDEDETPPEESSDAESLKTLSTSTPTSSPEIGSLWKTIEEVAMGALGLIGVHYKFGGNTPERGLDCSGFVNYVFQHALGIKLPRSSKELSQVGKRVDFNNLIPGDLVFFNTRHFAFSHVGIYLGDNRFIHAPRTGKEVEISRITSHYWSSHFDGGRRILGQLGLQAKQPSE